MISQLPKPFYQDDYATIYHGDSVALYPLIQMEGGGDLMIADPPYGMEYQSNCRAERFSRIIGDSEFPQWIFEQMPSRGGFVFGRWDNIGKIPEPSSVLVWDKGQQTMGDLQRTFGRSWEAIFFYPGADHRFRYRGRDLVRVNRLHSGHYLHPTEKPVGLFNYLLKCVECNCVIDPFMGSGPVLRAAKRMGIKAIGIELDEKYCEIAAKSLFQGVLDFGGQAA